VNFGNNARGQLTVNLEIVLWKWTIHFSLSRTLCHTLCALTTQQQASLHIHMSWLRRFLPLKGGSLFDANPKKFQEETDLHRLHLALEYYRRNSKGEWQDRSDAPWILGEEAASLELGELRKMVSGNIITQLRHLLVGDSGISTLAHDFKTSHGEFHLALRPSQIDNAGKGVWLDGKVGVGQVVAIFPGLAYKGTDIKSIPGYPNFGIDSDFMISRYDGRILDSRAWTYFGKGEIHEYNALRNQSMAGTSLLDSNWFCDESKENKYALGHMINHPPKGIAPNVMTAPVNWETNYSEHTLEKMLPWGNFEVDDETRVLHGVVFVALRAMHSEELFVNYRLNPAVLGGLPNWYHPVDNVEDGRRWY
jgi:hypothetical protein